MEYDFRKLEQDWQQKWKETNAYKTSNHSSKPKYYVLDMFPYPSGAGLHVGHPLGYIASDIYSRYKRLKGFNVLHPMGFDSFGLPAEQYALETGQHPATTTEKNIETFKKQLDKIGFCYDWDREVRTSDPSYYKWTQWIFLQLFNSWYNPQKQKAEPITELIKQFEINGLSEVIHQQTSTNHFTADEWHDFDEKQQQDILMDFRLAFVAFGEVNWCEALGTVLANDEVVNGVSERGGHPVEKKKMRQWYLRITAYADRLLQGLETVDFSESMKEMQRNWIGKSEGAEVEFNLIPNPSPQVEKGASLQITLTSANGGEKGAALVPKYSIFSPQQFELAKENRKGHTEAEAILWEELRGNNLGEKFRRQHPIDAYIVDFVCLQKALIIEVDGGYHETDEQNGYDKIRTEKLNEIGFEVMRFRNDEVQFDLKETILKIKSKLNQAKMSVSENVLKPQTAKTTQSITGTPISTSGEGTGLRVYTTRPDTIFGVDFLVLAPEHELVSEITTAEQKDEIEKYLTYVKSRSDRERQAEVKQITGCFTGAYASNPFNGNPIPVWIAEYVLAGYGTGAIMAVPCGDQRDFNFATHFNIPITNIIGEYFNGQEANPTKEATLQNSGFLNGLLMKDAMAVAINKIEELGIGKRKVNYRMRDAGFSRQRYWGEPFPIIWSDGIAIPLDEKELPLELPYVDKYGPGPNGEGPLANIVDWVFPEDLTPNASHPVLSNIDLTPNPSPKERGTEAPGYFNSSIQEWNSTINFAKENRKNSTETEDILWQELRNKKLGGNKFRRQHPVAGFIPDFICLEKKLILEIDGGYHNESGQKEYDETRQNWLSANGFEMLRFSNDEVINDIALVLQKIKQLLQKESKNEILGKSSPLLWRGVGGEVKRETSTMPGYAGSSWYFLRYMDPHNSQTFCDRKASDYWNQVDLYIGGTEHAVGHLLYSRLWTKVLFDLGMIGYDEPYKKLLNQGMIQGSSRFVYRVLWQGVGNSNFDNSKLPIVFVSNGYYSNTEKLKNLHKILNEVLKNSNVSFGVFEEVELIKLHVDVKYVDGYELDIEAFRKWKPEFADALFILEDGSVAGTEAPLAFGEGTGVRYICGAETEKMSKSKYNTVNPDDLCEKYGADTFRMYEMFLGPVEASKPWDTKGIEGVHRFIKKLWRLFFDDLKGKIWTENEPTNEELKVLHKAIKKIDEDTEKFSYNTAVSAFMVCVNELTDLKCNKKEVLESLLVLLSPYAPHISEELYFQLTGTSLQAKTNAEMSSIYPVFNPSFLVESEKEYPISINGKLRATMSFSLDAAQPDIEATVLQNEVVQKWLEGKPPKKIIFVKGKMINVVV